MITQISIYTENRCGTARAVLGVLSKENINVLNLVNNDSGEFGTMRMIVSNPDLAIEKLKENGYFCKADRVFAAELVDEPGALESFLSNVESMNISINYMYVGYIRENRTPVIVVKCDEMDIVEATLKNKGYTIY